MPTGINMGSFLSKIFNGKHSDGHQIHQAGDSRKVSTATGVPNDQNNQVLFKKSIRKSSAHNLHEANKIVNNRPQHSIETYQPESLVPAPSANVSFDAELLDDQEISLADSPFKRDYTALSHEVLVSLEKNRPRRSNVRRSSRLNPLQSRPVSEVQQEVEPKNKLFTIESQLSTAIYDDNEEEPISQMTESVKENTESDIDNLPQKEKLKIAQNRLNVLFDKKLMLPGGAMFMQTHRKDLQSQDTIKSDSFESFDSDFNIEKEVIREIGSGDAIHHVRPVSETFYISTETEVDKNSDLFTSEISEKEHTKKSFSPPRGRSGLIGNAMLIDELKKRQSTIFTSSD